MSESAVITDPADAVVGIVSRALAAVFDPDSEAPPVGGGTTQVRYFGGDGLPLAAFNAHSDGDGCERPFLWVRLARRYRSAQFPAPVADASNCEAGRAMQLEIGVGRCAVTAQEPSWDDYAQEAAVSTDDSWRLELALCEIRRRLVGAEAALSVATDAIVPYGPEGGVIAWLAQFYVSIP